MKIYTCPVSGDEIISDSFKFTEVDDVVYEVDCAWTTAGGAINIDTGANASAEGGDEEGTDDKAMPVIDAIDNHRLEEASFLKDKKEYGNALKKYFKKVKEVMKKEGKSDEEIKEWEKRAGAYAKDNILAKDKFKDLEMYITEHAMDYITADAHPIVLLLNYRDGEDGSKGGGNPYLIIWKAGLGETKL